MSREVLAEALDILVREVLAVKENEQDKAERDAKTMWCPGINMLATVWERNSGVDRGARV